VPSRPSARHERGRVDSSLPRAVRHEEFGTMRTSRPREEARPQNRPMRVESRAPMPRQRVELAGALDDREPRRLGRHEAIAEADFLAHAMRRALHGASESGPPSIDIAVERFAEDMPPARDARSSTTQDTRAATTLRATAPQIPPPTTTTSTRRHRRNSPPRGTLEDTGQNPVSPPCPPRPLCGELESALIDAANESSSMCMNRREVFSDSVVAATSEKLARGLRRLYIDVGT